ncbi:hypothetical protein Droror1_Dr00000310 [Drosera rotundifolia]
MADFDTRKNLALTSLLSPTPDKSPKGTVDAQILPLLQTLNRHHSLFSTSSCSGRISLFAHSPKSPKSGSWVFLSHEEANPDELVTLLFESKWVGGDSDLVFRFEPMIVAVECRNIGTARDLVAMAVGSGFRESGVTSVSGKGRVMVAIRCSIRMEVPLGRSDRILVSEEYVRYLVEGANTKMRENWRRMERFLEKLKSSSWSDGGVGRVAMVEGRNGDECGEAVERGEDDGLECEMERMRVGHDSGSFSPPHSNSVPVARIDVVGQPVERLYLWGHSCCTLGSTKQKKLLVFGGFGGVGRHARRNDCLLLELSCGMLDEFGVKGGPSPRMGQICVLVDDSIFVIGGRADPVNILKDVWILDLIRKEWKSAECSGSAFAPRHRHAAAALGLKIYVFGGLNKEVIYSSLLVLDVGKLQWSEVHTNGECPCARHSHTMVAYGSKLYVFGGFDGEKALGDLYSFDVEARHWEKVITGGRAPYPRFSHSMFTYKNFLGIIGGCPIRQHLQELAFLDLKTLQWNHITLNSDGNDMFVRCTGNVVGDDLIMIGGGASCYAFGTKFSEPVKIDLLPLTCSSTPTPLMCVEKTASGKRHGHIGVQINEALQSSDECLQSISEANRVVKHNTYWNLKLHRNYAKLGKDLLKVFGWLDSGRRVHSHEDGLHICFPVTEKFSSIFPDTISLLEGEYGLLSSLTLPKFLTDRGLSMSEFSSSTALSLLLACGSSKVSHKAEMRKVPIPPAKALREVVGSLLENIGLPMELVDQLPARWEWLGDIVVLPVTSFNDLSWETIRTELWPTVANSLGTHRLARQGRVAATGTRDSGLEIVVGDNGWVEHLENGIMYSFDASKCMFSWGNLSEKLRMARLDCRDEVIVDMFAGIGYFVLPFLVRSNAKLVYACEWNPHALEALRRNLVSNSVSDRCIVLEGDNRVTAPKGVADRVCLGLLPSSEGSWVTAVRALRPKGGVLHVHGNAKDSEEDVWIKHVAETILEIAKSEGRYWEVLVEHVERVKWYAPHIRHVVVDVICRQVPT